LQLNLSCLGNEQVREYPRSGWHTKNWTSGALRLQRRRCQAAGQPLIARPEKEPWRDHPHQAQPRLDAKFFEVIKETDYGLDTAIEELHQTYRQMARLLKKDKAE
jgi:hypothetical protein